MDVGYIFQNCFLNAWNAINPINQKLVDVDSVFRMIFQVQEKLQSHFSQFYNILISFNKETNDEILKKIDSEFVDDSKLTNQLIDLQNEILTSNFMINNFKIFTSNNLFFDNLHNIKNLDSSISKNTNLNTFLFEKTINKNIPFVNFLSSQNEILRKLNEFSKFSTSFETNNIYNNLLKELSIINTCNNVNESQNEINNSFLCNSYLHNIPFSLRENYKNEIINSKNGNLSQNALNIEASEVQQENFSFIEKDPNEERKLKNDYNDKNDQKQNFSQENELEESQNVIYEENLLLKQKFLEALKKSKHEKKQFQVVYMFKNKIKRMYRIDCMTRKINVNFYHYLKENQKNLGINDDLIDLVRNNIRFTSKNKFHHIEEKYPNFKRYYEEYLDSEKFKSLIKNIKSKYDHEYVKLFFRHSMNFLNYYLN